MSSSGSRENFQVCNSSAKTLLNTFLNDLRTIHSNNIDYIDDDDDFDKGRREVVIIMHATGVISVAQGWALDADDFPELLAAKVLSE